MSWTKEDRSFKTLINRRTTDSTGKFWYNEFSDSTLNIHSSEIWSDTINSSPAQAVIDGVAEQKTLFTLTLDNTVPSNQCYYAYDTIRLKDWISTKYGDGYLVRLYDNNNAEIFPTDACQWFFDYQTGILTFNGSTAAFTKPFKISGYRYIGEKGGSSGTSGSSGSSGVSGTSGSSGIGIDGSSGTSGSSGIGVDGTSGSSGTSGIGIDGTSGSSGISGTSGTSGAKGADGTSGSSGSSGSGTSGTSGSGSLVWYEIGSAGQEFNVCATGTGITLSRTGSAYTLNFPTGVRIITASIRIPLANMSSASITIATNLASSGDFVNRIILGARGVREDTGGSITPLVNDSTLTYTKWTIGSLSTTTHVYLILNFHQPLTV